MANRLNDWRQWLDSRTGYKGLLHEVLFENVPGGARWRYVWGSTLTFFFVVQVITGTFLWMSYSPSSQTAWESVYFIQHQMMGGWFLRGLHHFVAQAMTVLLVLHLMQVVIDGAYKAPREVNFWFGVALLLLILALSLTGYLLPWDQNGYWSTAVSTNLVGMSPVVGQSMQTVVVGGVAYGHHTLTRFFALHAGLIPGLIILLIVGHVYLFRKHGITPKLPPKGPDEGFWPEQVLRDAVACLAVLAAVVFFVVREHGAPLGAPADPAEQFSAARPEWYFLFLFQFLKYFPGKTEIIGAIILPTLVLLIIVAMPIIGRWRLGHRFNLGFLGVLLAGVALLTWQAVSADRNDAEYQVAKAVSRRDAERAVVLASGGVPITGALTLMREDAYTQGPRIFSRNCASCHRFDGHDGLGNALPTDSISASDLKGFGSRAWVSGFLHADTILTARYWGGTYHAEGDMAMWLADHIPEGEDEVTMRQNVVLALSAQAKLPSQAEVDVRDSARIALGTAFIRNTDYGCASCHTFEDVGTDSPDLTGWASRDWMIAFVNDPAHPRFFGRDNDRMPSYGVEKSLTQKEIEMVVDWIRGEWYTPGRKAAQR
ncbi:cytochrome b N-terminal domain-containing protein [Gemmatimonas sp. UBA7669]|uniref:cytochrome b N-terminal domain-containing protein n=1 Tax=Gemmatimonas sp. UBA7669 TaxID=1946568 RepID=UPI0025C2397F|nr:cytochrome b N-terminal domain-containing protein [Gemmatimonas sp. UBA7669]